MQFDVERARTVLMFFVLIAATACAPVTPTPIAATRTPEVVATSTTAPPTATPQATSTSEPAGIIATYILPDIPLASFQNAMLPGSITNDRKLMLGSIGSDLWHGAADPPNQFWMITDRGPNQQVQVRALNQERRTFPVPEFNPTIVHVQIQDGAIKILESIPILAANGKPVTGLPNLVGYDEDGYDYLAQTKLGVNPNGLDTEGLARAVGGDFWVSEEYSPSVLHLDKTGKVLMRYIPEGLELKGTDYPVSPVLPGILKKRKGNRGFDGMGMSESEKLLYLVVQSPMRNPDKKTGDTSRISRIFVFDIASEKVVAEFAYLFDVSTDFDPKVNPPPTEMKISAIVSVLPTKLLVQERTDELMKLYMVDTSLATNLTGTKWDDVATSPSLEALSDPSASGVKVLPKTPVMDFTGMAEIPPKMEGVAVLDRNTIAIANDNEFDNLGFDDTGNNMLLGMKNKIFIIRLAKPLY